MSQRGEGESCSPYFVRWSNEDKCWDVGIVQYGEFHAMEQFQASEWAYAFINYLNGGSGKLFVGEEV